MKSLTGYLEWSDTAEGGFWLDWLGRFLLRWGSAETNSKAPKSEPSWEEFTEPWVDFGQKERPVFTCYLLTLYICCRPGPLLWFPFTPEPRRSKQPLPKTCLTCGSRRKRMWVSMHWSWKLLPEVTHVTFNHVALTRVFCPRDGHGNLAPKKG